MQIAVIAVCGVRAYGHIVRTHHPVAAALLAGDVNQRLPRRPQSTAKFCRGRFSEGRCGTARSGQWTLADSLVPHVLSPRLQVVDNLTDDDEECSDAGNPLNHVSPAEAARRSQSSARGRPPSTVAHQKQEILRHVVSISTGAATRGHCPHVPAHFRGRGNRVRAESGGARRICSRSHAEREATFGAWSR